MGTPLCSKHLPSSFWSDGWYSLGKFVTDWIFSSMIFFFNLSWLCLMGNSFIFEGVGNLHAGIRLRTWHHICDDNTHTHRTTSRGKFAHPGCSFFCVHVCGTRNFSVLRASHLDISITACGGDCQDAQVPPLIGVNRVKHEAAPGMVFEAPLVVTESNKTFN